MSETNATRTRFLGAIAAQVQPASIVEAHLFQPIRQGGFESGVAVVAVAEESGPQSASEATSVPDAGEPAETGEPAEGAKEIDAVAGAEGPDGVGGGAEAPGLEAGEGDEMLAELEQADGVEAGVAERDDAHWESRPKLAVYTAKYRLTLKGPDRGKWDFAMTAEADAPLVTVDAVVRGVQRRSGDVDEPEKLSGDEFRELLPAEEPTTATPSSS